MTTGLEVETSAKLCRIEEGKAGVHDLEVNLDEIQREPEVRRQRLSGTDNIGP